MGGTALKVLDRARCRHRKWQVTLRKRRRVNAKGALNRLLLPADSVVFVEVHNEADADVGEGFSNVKAQLGVELYFV